MCVSSPKRRNGQKARAPVRAEAPGGSSFCVRQCLFGLLFPWTFRMVEMISQDLRAEAEIKIRSSQEWKGHLGISNLVPAGVRRI